MNEKAARAKAASTSPRSMRISLATLRVPLMHLGRAVGCQRRLGARQRRQFLVLDVDQVERVARRLLVDGDDDGDLLAGEAHLVHGEDAVLLAVDAHCRAGVSAPVSTSLTPGSACAARTSMRAMRACGYGLRSTLACSMPGSWMSPA